MNMLQPEVFRDEIIVFVQNLPLKYFLASNMKETVHEAQNKPPPPFFFLYFLPNITNHITTISPLLLLPLDLSYIWWQKTTFECQEIWMHASLTSRLVGKGSAIFWQNK